MVESEVVCGRLSLHMYVSRTSARSITCVHIHTKLRPIGAASLASLPPNCFRKSLFVTYERSFFLGTTLPSIETELISVCM